MGMHDSRLRRLRGSARQLTECSLRVSPRDRWAGGMERSSDLQDVQRREARASLRSHGKALRGTGRGMGDADGSVAEAV